MQTHTEKANLIVTVVLDSSRSYDFPFFAKHNSRGTKVEKMLTLAPERYTAGFCMVAKVIQWCI